MAPSWQYVLLSNSLEQEEGRGNGILPLGRDTYPFCFYLIIQSKPCGPVGKLSTRQLRAVILGCPKVEMNWRLVNSRSACHGDLMEMAGSSLNSLHLVAPVGIRRKAEEEQEWFLGVLIATHSLICLLIHSKNTL